MRRDLESLVGSLHHACKVVQPGRCFLRCILNLFRGLRRPNHPIRLNVSFTVISLGGSSLFSIGMVLAFS